MRILITGSAGHLGEALVRVLRESEHEVVGLDLLATPFTDRVGSIVDRAMVRECMDGVDAVLHTATLHKPHVVTHTAQQFIDTNVSGTLNLLEEARRAGVGAFVFTSTTSVFGRAFHPGPDEPAVWVTEALAPRPKNIYGVTKLAAENLCELAHHENGLACLVLRTSRFFLEQDDNKAARDTFDDANLKTNEYLHRRVDLQDVVDAHLAALARASELGFGRYVISATTPLLREDLRELRHDAPNVVARRVPGYAQEYARRQWRMYGGIERVYVNALARRELGWTPRFDFAAVLEHLRRGDDPRSELSRAVGSKPYHERRFEDGPYPVR